MDSGCIDVSEVVFRENCTLNCLTEGGGSQQNEWTNRFEDEKTEECNNFQRVLVKLSFQNLVFDLGSALELKNKFLFV